MLRSLSIRNIVLIESLDLDLGVGLNVLTGETGAGKSILMDSLCFALGMKVRRDLLRAGATEGSVVAEFELTPTHPVMDRLREADLPCEDGDLLMRRVIGSEGRSRAFVNDQRVSAQVLQDIGALLIEVHGQHDDRGLLDPKGHRALLDAYARLDDELAAVRSAWTAVSAYRKALREAEDAASRASADADFIRHSVDELETLSPEPGEDESLDAERRLIRKSADLTGEVNKAAALLGMEGAEACIADAISRLGRIAEQMDGRLETAISALDRTLTELADAQSSVSEVQDALTFDPGRLDEVEERLFAIRGLARKHGVQPEELHDLAMRMTARLQEIDGAEDRIAALKAEVADAEAAYTACAQKLTDGRRVAGQNLDAAVTAELPALKMESAQFVTELTSADPGPGGVDAVRFTARINAGAPSGPIDRIASGGELSRFLLAMKVQLAASETDQTMIFDEIDRGLGGATANAVGHRLSRLADAGQVLVVTHSPQVAARANVHFRIAKSSDGVTSRTDVVPLAQDERTDEIARMLAGDTITEAARSAARALIDDR